MPVERAREEHVAANARIEPLHQLALAADGCDREAVRDRLAHRRDIRCHAADRLIAADVVAKSGDDLVENENHALTVADLAQPFEKRLFRQDASDVMRDRLQDDPRDIAWIRPDRRLDALEVVEAAD